jgi:hypothetical protein
VAGLALGKRGGVFGDGFGVGFIGVWSCTAVLEVLMVYNGGHDTS